MIYTESPGWQSFGQIRTPVRVCIDSSAIGSLYNVAIIAGLWSSSHCSYSQPAILMTVPRFSIERKTSWMISLCPTVHRSVEVIVNKAGKNL